MSRGRRKSLFGGDKKSSVTPDMERELEKKRMEEAADKAVGMDDSASESAKPLDRDAMLQEYHQKVDALNDLLQSNADKKTQVNTKNAERSKLTATVQDEKSRLEASLAKLKTEQTNGFLKELKDVEQALGDVVADIQSLDNSAEMEGFITGLGMIGKGLSNIFNDYSIEGTPADAVEMTLQNTDPTVSAETVEKLADADLDAVRLATEIKAIDQKTAEAQSAAQDIDAKLQQATTLLDNAKSNLEKDLQNLQKEYASAQTTALKKVAEATITTVADNLERSIKLLPKQQDKLGGIFNSVSERLTKAEAELQDAFLKFGIEKVESPVNGTPDYNVHQEVAKIAVPGKDTGTILDVQENGYKLNGRLLRPAKILVAE